MAVIFTHQHGTGSATVGSSFNLQMGFDYGLELHYRQAIAHEQIKSQNHTGHTYSDFISFKPSRNIKI